MAYMIATHTRKVGMTHPNIHKQGEDIKVKVNTQNLIHLHKSEEVARDIVHVYYYVVA